MYYFLLILLCIFGHFLSFILFNIFISAQLLYYQKSSGLRIWRKWKNEIIRQRKFSKKIRISSQIIKNDKKSTLKNSKSANNLNEYEKKNENKIDNKNENNEDDELNHRKLIKKSFLLVTNYCSYSRTF